MWVARGDMKPLPIPKQLPNGLAVGNRLRARLPTGEFEEVILTDIRQGLKRGAHGLRLKCQLVGSADADSYWARVNDVEVVAAAAMELPAPPAVPAALPGFPTL